MTNKQIDEINELLETNGEALTAFYKEGMTAGAVVGIIGLVTAWAWLVCSAYAANKIVKKYQEKKRSKAIKKEEQSY